MSQTDTKRLNFLIANRCDIDAPTKGESYTWVVYDAENSLGHGLGCAYDLRTAIDIAILTKNKK
jgi:hypothetical protein